MAESDKDQMEGAFGITGQEWSDYTKNLTENTEPLPEITGKDVATFVAEMTPIIGDAMAAKEVYDELQKEEPNYYLVGALAGATAVGLIPGIGDAAAQAIKTGARKGLDFAKRIEVDPNAFGSMGGNIRLKPATDNLLETTRPLFREGTSSGVADFYSPTREFIEGVDIPSKGLKGSELIKQLQKTPDVKSSEIDLLGIDPQARYSREQLIEQYDKNSYKILAENPTELDFKGDYKFFDTQRQELANNLDVTDYEEIIVRAQKEDGFRATGTHHTPDTVAHLRTSRVYDTDTGDKFYLIEEIQSDVVAHGARKPRGKVTYEEAINEEATLTVDQILKQYDPDVREQLSKQRSFLEEVFKSQTDRNNLDAYDEVYKKYGEDLSGHLVETTGISRTNANYIFNALDNEAYKVAELPKEELTRAISKPPIKDVNEVARIGLQTAIADALKKGNTKVVIPNLERIVAADRARPGTEQFKKMTAPGSSFHRMYVTGLEKAINEIKKDLPEMQVGSMDLNYAFRKELPSNATVLDLSAYEGKNLSRLRFAEGGEVKSMEEQMSLFERGGLADGGLDREPVTGNEVPPGSMPSEVRDDVPAQLSEGEYVVPADVVRYYGVKFFEDLRTEAKGGMMKMDQEGRIGGTAVDTNGVPVEDDTLSPEEEQMLMEALAAERPQGMATGGMVRGYATAGDVTKPTYTPTGGYGAAPMQMGGYGQAGSFEARQYVNTSTGQIRTFQFLNGMPISMIPEGFVPATQEAIAAAGQAKDQTTTETTGTGQATGKVEPEGRGFDPEKDTVDGEGRTKDPTAPFGIGTGAVGTGLAAGVVGGALTGGLGGALGFGKAGMQAGAFNEARNGLVDAMLSGDKDAIAKAKEDVTSTYGQLGNLAHIGVFNEGKTAKDAIAYVEKYTNDLMAKYNLTPGPKTRQNILAAINKTPTTSTAIAKNAPGSLTGAEAQLGSAASITAADKAAGAAYAATGDERGDTWGGGGVAENQGWSGGQMDYGGDSQGGGAVGSARGGRATGGLVGKPSKNPPKKKSATKGLGGRR